MQDHVAESLVQVIRAGFFPNDSEARRGDEPIAEWDEIARYAESQRLAPLLYAALKARGRQNEPPPHVVSNLRTAYLRADVANWLKYQELSRLLEIFAREQIPVVLLKGCALAATLYPERALREMGDLDLLIHKTQLEPVATLLVAQSYTLVRDIMDGFQEEFAGEQQFSRADKYRSAVDLHWHILNLATQRRQVPVDWFWDRTQEVRIDGHSAYIFAPGAQLLHLAAHFALHHQLNGLRWSFDLALLLARDGEYLDWDEILDAARAFGLAPAFRAAVSHVSDLWGVSVAKEVQMQIAKVESKAGDRMAFWVASAPKPAARIVMDGLSMSGLRKKLAYLFHMFFPSPRYMVTRYRVRHPILLPVYYLIRQGIGLYKFARSMVSIGAHVSRSFAKH